MKVDWEHAQEHAQEHATNLRSQRFLAVHFTHWSIDLARVNLRRALRRDWSSSLARSGAVHGFTTPMSDNASDSASDTAWASLSLDAIPLLIIEEEHRVWHIVSCCTQASAHGVRSGMSMSQAEVVCPLSAEARQIRDLRTAFASRIARPIASPIARPTKHALRDADNAPYSDAVRAHVGGHANIERLIERITYASDRVLGIRRDHAHETRMLLRLGRCLERWIPSVSIDAGCGGIDGIDARLAGAMSPIHVPHDRAHDRAHDPAHDPAPRTPCTTHVRQYAPVLVGDLSGCAMLFRTLHGSEQTLMARIRDSFLRRGFSVHLATASTIGAATAIARFATSGSTPSAHRTVHAIRSGCELDALDPLRVEALRISPRAIEALHSVEVLTIGQLARLKRSGIAERFAGRFHGDDEHARKVNSVAAPVKRGMSGRNTRSQSARTRSSSSRTQSLHGTLFGESAHAISEEIERIHSSASKLQIDAVAGIDEVLHRLDQALGTRPESLCPLRSQKQMVLRRVFDGPVHQLESIFVACAGMIDELVRALALRREGLRAASWRFLHAPFPVDLSTDHAPEVFQLNTHVPQSGSTNVVKNSAPPQVRERIPLDTRISHTHIDFRLSRASASRVHLWNMLRPKLERLSLEYAVEEIECRIDEAVLLRYRQGFMLEAPTRETSGAPMLLQTGVATLQKATRSESREKHHDERRSEWIDIVSTRLGASHMSRPRGASTAATVLARECCGSSRPVDCEGAMQYAQSDPLADAHRIAAPRADTPRAMVERARVSCVDRAETFTLDRPPQRFKTPECAWLRGGCFADSLARSVAQRTVWCSESQPSLHAETQPWPTVFWRDRTWFLHAIDSWERVASPWWKAETDHATHDPTAPPTRIAPSEHTARVSGRVYSKVQLGTQLHTMAHIESRGGLWVFVQWPMSFQQQRSVHEQQTSASLGAARARDPPAVVPPRDHSLHDHSSCEHSTQTHDPWLLGCATALQNGIELAVLGVWG